MSITMQATRPGLCLSCDYGIRAGQSIQLNDDAEYGGRWEHVTCPTARPVCPECFVEVSVSGACVCGAM